MAQATWIQTNFNGGEWTPLAWGRADLPKYKNGLSVCQNFMPQQQGGLTRRPGTRAVSAVKDSSVSVRLQRFEFSMTQAYVLEFGHQYIRFYTGDGQLNNGGTIIEVATPYTAAEIWGLDFRQSADVLYIAHASHPPMKLQRQGTYTWTLTAISFLDGPYLPTNSTTTTLTPSATTGTVTVTASAITGINGGVGFKTTDVGRMLRVKCGGVWLWGTIAGRVSATQITWTITQANGERLPATAKALANVSGGSIFTITVTDGGSGYGVTPPAVSFSGAVTVTATAHVSSVDGSGKITGVVLDTGGSGYSEDPTVTVAGGSGTAIIYAHTVGGVVSSLYVGDGGSGYTTASAIGFTGGGATVGSGCAAYANVSAGVVTNITVMVTGTGYTTPPSVVLGPPAGVVPSTTTFWRLGLYNSDNGYPSAVSFHQDRLWWGGCTQYPNRADASNTGDYENMAPTELDGSVIDSDALSFTLNSNQVDAIVWMASDEWGMLVGTVGGEWCIAPSSQQQAITPTNVNAKQMGSYGSADMAPLRISKATFFLQRTGRKLREMTYQFMNSTFTAADISLVGEHLTESGLKQMAVQLAPQQIIWVVRNDGFLVGVTYDKDQDICGWHDHVLGGFSDAAQTSAPVVESVATIPAPGIQRDEVWLSVKRYINGAVVRTVEVMSKMWEDGDATATCNFLDCSAELIPSDLTVSGLSYLKGQTVGVLTDGAVHANCVVSGSGTITLQWTASLVQVGLPYTSTGQSLHIEAGGGEGPAQGKIRRIHRAVFSFFQSVGLTVGSNVKGVNSYPQTFRGASDPISQAVGLFSGIKRWSYEGTWSPDGMIFWSTSDPLPCNITQIMAQLDTEDAT